MESPHVGPTILDSALTGLFIFSMTLFRCVFHLSQGSSQAPRIRADSFGFFLMFPSRMRLGITPFLIKYAKLVLMQQITLIRFLKNFDIWRFFQEYYFEYPISNISKVFDSFIYI